MPEFDLVAPVYDATRRPPSPQEFGAVVGSLRPSRVVLEAGIGTGRYSSPLESEGFEMTGVDLSVEMMRRAREKGLRRLVRGDLHRLPFRDGAFDACLIVHVLQLIPDPKLALAELRRVARDRVVAVFPERSGEGREWREQFRARYRELAAERGVDVTPFRRYWESASELLRTVPPESTQRVEETVEPDPERERAWAQSHSFGGMVGVPEQVHQEIVAQIRAERGARPRPVGPRTRVMQIATWRSGGRGAAPARASRPGPR